MLDAPERSGPPAAPSIKFDAIGGNVIGALVDVVDFHQTDYDSPPDAPDYLYWVGRQPTPASKITGSTDQLEPVLGKRLVILVTDSTDATVAVYDADGDRTDERTAPAPGSIASVYCQGGKFLAYRDGRNAAKGVDVGDKVRFAWVGTEPASNPRHNDRNVFKFDARRPTPEDGDLPQRAKQARIDLQERTTVDSADNDAAGGVENGDPF